MEQPPLSDLIIAITRSAEGNETWTNEFIELGATVYHLATIALKPVKMTSDLEHTLTDLAHVDWLVFTSATGVHYFRDMANEIDLDLTSREIPPVAVIGSNTAEAARELGLRVEFTPSKDDSETLGRELSPVSHKHVLLMRTTVTSEELPAKLKKRGAKVEDLKIHTSDPRTDPDEEFNSLLRKERVSYIVFLNAEEVAGFCARVTGDDLLLAQELPAVALDPTIGNALTHANFRRVLTAERPTLAGIIMTILDDARYSTRFK